MNYFDYFSEIEERFTARRGSLLLLSTLDWALIETWREAEIPLAAVLRGIDTAFDKYQERKSRAKGRLAKVNGLAWCAQAVLEAAAAMAEASIGAHEEKAVARETGFETERVAEFLERNAATLAAQVSGAAAEAAVWKESLHSTATRLRELAGTVRAEGDPALHTLDRTLTLLDERLQAALLTSVSEAELLRVRDEAEGELAPYRARLGAVQLRQIREQFVQKRLFEARRLPRLSLFYMPVGEAESAPGPDREREAPGT